MDIYMYVNNNVLFVVMFCKKSYFADEENNNYVPRPPETP